MQINKYITGIQLMKSNKNPSILVAVEIKLVSWTEGPI